MSGEWHQRGIVQMIVRSVGWILIALGVALVIEGLSPQISPSQHEFLIAIGLLFGVIGFALR